MTAKKKSEAPDDWKLVASIKLDPPQTVRVRLPDKPLGVCRPIGAKIGPAMIKHILKHFYLRGGQVRARKTPYLGEIGWEEMNHD